MDERLKKTERLIKMWVIIHNNPNGYTIGELAEKFEVNKRTVYRDLMTLQSDLDVPLYDENRRWKLDEKRVLPPIRFTVPEALNVFLAARLMVGYDKRYDPNMDATFSKLGSILPAPLAEQVQKTVDWMRNMPKNERYLSVLAKLAEAWINRRRVKIAYRSLDSEAAKEHLIEPYFIQPAAAGHSSYTVAYSQRNRTLLTFKIDRIENIQVTGETYTIPPDFDANRYFSSAWGIVADGEIKTIKLKFAPGVARIIEETPWHLSEVKKKQKDGSLLITLIVMDTVEFKSWVLGWGEQVEVLEPPEIREAVIETAETVSEMYRKKK